jgi:hypothetical protein
LACTFASPCLGGERKPKVMRTSKCIPMQDKGSFNFEKKIKMKIVGFIEKLKFISSLLFGTINMENN